MAERNKVVGGSPFNGEDKELILGKSVWTEDKKQGSCRQQGTIQEVTVT